MTLAEFHERVCEPPLAQGEEKRRVTAVLLCFDNISRASVFFKCKVAVSLAFAFLVSKFLAERLVLQKNSISALSFNCV